MELEHWLQEQIGSSESTLLEAIVAHPTLLGLLQRLAHERMAYVEFSSDEARRMLRSFTVTSSIVFSPQPLTGTAIGSLCRARAVELLDAEGGSCARAEIAEDGSWALPLQSLAAGTTAQLSVVLDPEITVAAARVQRSPLLPDQLVLDFLRQAGAFCAVSGRREEAALLLHLCALLSPCSLEQLLEASSHYAVCGMPHHAEALAAQALARATDGPSQETLRVRHAELRARLEREREYASRYEAWVGEHAPQPDALPGALHQLRTAMLHGNYPHDVDFLIYCRWRAYRAYPRHRPLLHYLSTPCHIDRVTESEAIFRRRFEDLYPDDPESVEIRARELLQQGRWEDLVQTALATPATPLTAIAGAQALMQQQRADLLEQMRTLLHRLPAAPHFAPAKELIELFCARRGTRQQDAPLPGAGRPDRAAARVAVCISGQLRGFEEALPTIQKQLVERFNAVPFVSSWEQVGRAVGPHAGRDRRGLPRAFAAQLPADFNTALFYERFPSVREALAVSRRAARDDVLRLLPSAIVELENEEALRTLLPPELQADYAYYLFYKMHRVYRLVVDYEQTRGERFDVIIWVRPDLCIEALEMASLPEMQHAVGCWWFMEPAIAGDYFCFGNREEMHTFLGIWEQLQGNAFRPYLPSPSGGAVCGPLTIFEHLVANGLSVIGLPALQVLLRAELRNPVPPPIDFLIALLDDYAALPPDVQQRVKPWVEGYLREVGRDAIELP